MQNSGLSAMCSAESSGLFGYAAFLLLGSRQCHSAVSYQLLHARLHRHRQYGSIAV